MKPKRVFQVYRESTQVHRGPFKNAKTGRAGTMFRSEPFEGSTPCPDWRFRVLAPRAPIAHRIVGGSGEAFDSKSNAKRAAKREASLYPPGVAAVEVLE